MNIKLKVECICGCTYYINNKIKVDKISCPNCGDTIDSSDDIIKLIKLVNRIPSDYGAEKKKTHISIESTT